MTEDKNRAQGAQQVATTMEAAQGVQDQKSIGAEPTAQLNPNKVTVSQKQTNLCSETDYSSTSLIHNLFTPNSIDMIESFRAQGAQEVVTTKEAAQGVQAQNNVGAEQTALLNPNKVTVRQKWTTMTNDTDHRPVGIIHYFTPSGEYIKSVMKTTLHKWGYTTYLKSDGSVSSACYWIPTKQNSKEHEFNFMCPSTMDPRLEAFWAKVMECYDHRSVKMIYDGTRIPVQYLTTEVKATRRSYANPLF